jgi:hypothetical protein
VAADRGLDTALCRKIKKLKQLISWGGKNNPDIQNKISVLRNSDGHGSDGSGGEKKF